MKTSNVCCTLAIVIAALATGRALAANKPTLVGLDIELTGDTVIEDLKETASARPTAR